MNLRIGKKFYELPVHQFYYNRTFNDDVEVDLNDHRMYNYVVSVNLGTFIISTTTSFQIGSNIASSFIVATLEYINDAFERRKLNKVYEIKII